MNLDHITERAVEKFGWDKTHAEHMARVYERYLSVKRLNPDLSATEDTKKYWELHLLDTNHYREYCINHFGVFIEHDPSKDEFTEREKDKPELKHFGLVPGEKDCGCDGTTDLWVRLVMAGETEKNTGDLRNYDLLYERKGDVSNLRRDIESITGVLNKNIHIYRFNDLNRDDLAPVDPVSDQTRLTGVGEMLLAIIHPG